MGMQRKPVAGFLRKTWLKIRVVDWYRVESRLLPRRITDWLNLDMVPKRAFLDLLGWVILVEERDGVLERERVPERGK
jgi:hypothetical protein